MPDGKKGERWEEGGEYRVQSSEYRLIKLSQEQDAFGFDVAISSELCTLNSEL
jgi:hypothetical protein